MNINLDDGYKEFTINNDQDRVIRFNPSDVAIIGRFKKAADALENLMKDNQAAGVDMEDAAERVRTLDNAIKEQIDIIFNYPVSDIVFGNQSPMATVDGVMLFERFFNAVLPVIRESVEKERKASEKRIKKYVDTARKV